ncbi:MAG: FitA-like ribbon-helix-helix domain-containing protein [Acidimicrobiales bacterium]
MPNVLIRDLSPDVHATLTRRAEAAGQSLQQYLVAELTQLAETPTIEDVVAAIRRQSGGARGVDTVKFVHEAREERLRHLMGLLPDQDEQ